MFEFDFNFPHWPGEHFVDNLHRRKGFSQILNTGSQASPLPLFLEAPLLLLCQLGLVGLPNMPGNLFIQKFLLLFQCTGKKP